MAEKNRNAALEVEALWKGHIMQSDWIVPGRPYTIGGGREASFPLDADVLDGNHSWTLVASDGAVRVPPCAGGQQGTVHLSQGESVRVALGDFEFRIRAMAPPARLRLPLEFDWRAFSLATAGVLLTGLVLTLVWFYVPLPLDRWSALGKPRLTDPVLREPEMTPAGLVSRTRANTGGGVDCSGDHVIERPLVSLAGRNIGPSFGIGSFPMPGTGLGGGGMGEGTLIPESDIGSLLGYGMCMMPEAEDP